MQSTITVLLLKVSLFIWTALMLAHGVSANVPASDPTRKTTVQSSAPTKAQHTNLIPQKLEQSVVRQADTLDLLRKSVERLRSDDPGLERKRLELEQLIKEMNATKAALTPLLIAVDREISQLTPSPKVKEDTTTTTEVEVPELVQERHLLNGIRTRIIAAQKRTALSLLRAENLEKKIQEYHLQNFTNNILKRSESLFSGALWHNLDAALPRLWIQITTIADNWWTTAKLNPIWLSLILLSSAICYALLFLIRKHILKSTLTESTKPRPGFLRRALMTSFWFVPIMAMPGAVTAMLIFAQGDVLNIWEGTIRTFAHSALWAFLVFSLVTALASGVLQPQHPGWRLVAMPTQSARRLLWATNSIAAVYAADLFLHDIILFFYMPVEIRILETSLANVAFAALLAIFALAALPNRPKRSNARFITFSLNIVRISLVLAAIAILAVTLTGYVALGRFIAGQVMIIGAGSIIVLLLHLAIRVIATKPEKFSEPIEHLFNENTWLSAERWQKMINIIAVLANILVFVIALVLLLLSWGFPLSQLLNVLKSLFFGFEIGQFQISLFGIGMAVGSFLLVLFVTRLMQGWMNRSILKAPTVDRGIAHSLHTGLGYVGVGIALFVGISFIGVDLTQLTFVIGALSLGVGLGLQSIVNNFVSGLILLVERPVKVGDWVVIGNEQGYVRKISVRATEIETFDRASVIIPNSALISGTVQNWTHRSNIGRIVIELGVSYDADPQEVHNVLLDIAKASDKVLGFPEPFVCFENFGSSSLDFSLRCYVADINSGLSTKSALRMAILKRFKELGIEIPYPQRDLHLRNLTAVEAALGKTQKQPTKKSSSVSEKQVSRRARKKLS